MVDQPVIKIFSTKMCISCCWLYFKNPTIDCKNWYIECSTTKIKNQHVGLLVAGLLFVEPISNSSSCWLIDYSQNIQASDYTSILGCLPLRVIKVCGNSYHGILHLMPKVWLCCLLHFCQNHCTNLFWCEGLLIWFVFYLQFGFSSMVSNFEGPVFHVWLNCWIIVVSTDQSLCIKNGVTWIHCNLIFCPISNETFSVCETYIAGGGPITLVIGNDLHFAVLEDPHAGVSCAKVNTNGCFLTHLRFTWLGLVFLLSFQYLLY